MRTNIKVLLNCCRYYVTNLIKRYVFGIDAGRHNKNIKKRVIGI